MKEVDAIWASAVYAYRNDEPSALSIEQEEQVYKENVNYMLDSPWREPIESWLREPKNRFEYVTADLLLTQAVGKPVERQTRFDQMQVASILRAGLRQTQNAGERSTQMGLQARLEEVA